MIDAVRGFNAIKAKLDVMTEEEKIAYLTRMGFTLEDKENSTMKPIKCQKFRDRRLYSKHSDRRAYGRVYCMRIARGNKKR